MQSRNSKGRSWTKIPEELCQQARELFAQNFKEKAKAAKWIVEGRIFPNEVVLRAGFTEPGKLQQINFDVSSDKSDKEDPFDQISLLIDLLASLFSHYFTEKLDPKELSVEWDEVDFEGMMAYYKFDSTNMELEKQADELLGLKEDDRLVKDKGDHDDLAEVLNTITKKNPEDNH